MFELSLAAFCKKANARGFSAALTRAHHNVRLRSLELSGHMLSAFMGSLEVGSLRESKSPELFAVYLAGVGEVDDRLHDDIAHRVTDEETRIFARQIAYHHVEGVHHIRSEKPVSRSR